MDVTINKDLLVREFGLARRLGERKATLPTYSYARVEADLGTVHISATDGEAALETTCPAVDVGEPGVMLVPIRTLHELARASAVDGIRLSTDKDRLLVHAGGFKSKLGTLPVEHFPNIPSAPDATTKLPTALLRKVLAKTRFVVEGASGKTGNPCFHGALFALDGKDAEFVATDGYRLSLLQTQLDQAAPKSGAIVPRKALDDLLALVLLEDAPEHVSYVAADGKAYFTLDQRTYATRLIDGDYVNYKRIVPKLAAPSADLDRDTFLGVLRRVMLVSSEEVRKADITVNGKSLTATMDSATVGTATESLDVAVTGDGWETAFDAKYLAEGLAAAEAGTLRFCQANPNAGARFQSIEPGLEFSYMIMPMRR